MPRSAEPFSPLKDASKRAEITVCLTTQDLALLLFAPAAAAVLWAAGWKRLLVPLGGATATAHCPGLLGLDSPGSWLCYALGALLMAAVWP